MHAYVHCVYIHTCTYVYTYVHVHTCTHAAHTHTCTHTRTHTHTHTHTNARRLYIYNNNQHCMGHTHITHMTQHMKALSICMLKRVGHVRTHLRAYIRTYILHVCLKNILHTYVFCTTQRVEMLLMQGVCTYSVTHGDKSTDSMSHAVPKHTAIAHLIGHSSVSGHPLKNTISRACR